MGVKKASEGVMDRTKRLDYLYRGSGLDNVIIAGLEVAVDDKGRAQIEIPYIHQLHKAIAEVIIGAPTGMRPQELRFLRTELGRSQAELAAMLSKDAQTVGRWERGETPIDPNAELIIRLIVAEILDINLGRSVQDMTGSYRPAATYQPITIDGRDPSNYRPLAA